MRERIGGIPPVFPKEVAPKGAPYVSAQASIRGES